MERFSPEYFELSDQDRADVIKYQTTIHEQSVDIPADEIGQYDSLACAMLYRGRPLSNAFFVHEREEIRSLQQAGVNPLVLERTPVVTHPSYSRSHARALGAEYSYLQLLARTQYGFDIPVHLLMLFNPALDMIQQEFAIEAYSSIFEKPELVRLRRKLLTVNDWSDLPEDILPTSVKRNISLYYSQLLHDEPLWRVVAEGR